LNKKMASRLTKCLAFLADLPDERRASPLRPEEQRGAQAELRGGRRRDVLLSLDFSNIRYAGLSTFFGTATTKYDIFYHMDK
jgi:hypothetical protein